MEYSVIGFILTLTTVFRKPEESIKAFVTFQSFDTHFAWTLSGTCITKLLNWPTYITITRRTVQANVCKAKLKMNTQNKTFAQVKKFLLKLQWYQLTYSTFITMISGIVLFALTLSTFAITNAIFGSKFMASAQFTSFSWIPKMTGLTPFTTPSFCIPSGNELYQSEFIVIKDCLIFVKLTGKLHIYPSPDHRGLHCTSILYTLKMVW